MSDSRLKFLAPHSLIPGLPDDVVINCILPRLSWTLFPSLLRVSKGWKSAFTSGLIGNIRRAHSAFPERLLALIHKSTHRPLADISLSLAVSVYDPILCVWEELPPIPFIPHGAPMFARCVCVKGKLFVLGGCNPHDWQPVGEVYAMDLGAGLRKWEKCRGMKTARANFACICHEGKIFVAGGHGRDSLVLATAELYDVESNHWQALPDLCTPRSECLGAVLNNQICILGGYSSSFTDNFTLLVDFQSTYCFSTMEILDKHCRKWTSITTTGVPLHSFTIASGQLCPLTDGAVYEFNSDHTTSGKLLLDGMLISHFANGEDEDGPYLALAAITVNQEMYAITRDSSSYYGKGFSFSKGKRGKPCAQGTGGVKWQSIECPFEIVELDPSCCTVCL